MHELRLCSTNKQESDCLLDIHILIHFHVKMHAVVDIINIAFALTMLLKKKKIVIHINAMKFSKFNQE